jgi:phosphate starvation-inducible PhoH-like protein
MTRQRFGSAIIRDVKGQNIYAKTQGQLELIEAIENNDVIFVHGPAGTGKTYLAIAKAVKLLQEGGYEGLKLTRPIIEAEEELGFLPGTLEDKVDPYMRPLYDSIDDFVEKPKTQTDQPQIKKTKRQKVEESNDLSVKIREGIEICPLAYMRGRTFKNSIVILDEAQNTTVRQMKMFLSRMGSNAKLIITGDIDQIDLPRTIMSGLMHAVKIMDGIPKLAIVEMNGSDIVRNPMVKDMLARYNDSLKGPEDGNDSSD